MFSCTYKDLYLPTLFKHASLAHLIVRLATHLAQPLPPRLVLPPLLLVQRPLDMLGHWPRLELPLALADLGLDATLPLLAHLTHRAVLASVELDLVAEAHGEGLGNGDARPPLDLDRLLFGVRGLVYLGLLLEAIAEVERSQCHVVVHGLVQTEVVPHGLDLPHAFAEAVEQAGLVGASVGVSAFDWCVGSVWFEDLCKIFMVMSYTAC